MSQVMGWMQESKASVNRALQSGLGKMDEQGAHAQGQANYARTPQPSATAPSLWETRMGKNRAREEANLQLGQTPGSTHGCPQRAHKILALSHELAMRLGPGCVYIETDLFRVCRGSEQPAAPRDGVRLLRVNTFPSCHVRCASLHVLRGTIDACRLQPSPVSDKVTHRVLQCKNNILVANANYVTTIYRSLA